MPTARFAALLLALALSACAYVHPDAPEFGLSPGGDYNPVSHEVNDNGR